MKKITKQISSKQKTQDGSLTLYATRLYHKAASEVKISRFIPKTDISYASSVMKFLIT